MKFSVLFLRSTNGMRPYSYYVGSVGTSTGFDAVVGNHYIISATHAIGEANARIRCTGGTIDLENYGLKPSLNFVTATETHITVSFVNTGYAGSMNVIDLGDFPDYNPSYLGSYNNSSGFDAEIGKYYVIYAQTAVAQAVGPIIVKNGTNDAFAWTKPSVTVTQALDTKITASYPGTSTAGTLQVFHLT